MNLLLDMNLSPRWCEILRAAGYATVHWSEVGDPRASDATIMEWARRNDYVVLTHDLDFSAILAATRAAGPSVVQMRGQNVLPSGCGPLLLKVLEEYATELLSGALLVADDAKSRVRILPLSSSA